MWFAEKLHLSQIKELTKHQFHTLENAEAKQAHKINELMETSEKNLCEQKAKYESLEVSMQQKVDELSTSAKVYIGQSTKYKTECNVLVLKLEDLENARKEEQKCIEGIMKLVQNRRAKSLLNSG